MVNFLGRASSKVDDKGRVVFPAVFKNAMYAGEGSDMRLVVKKDIYASCLEMYTYSEWERQSEAIRSRLNLAFNREHAAFWRKYMSDCAVVTPDEKLGRLSIPKDLLESIGVTKEVLFAGIGYKIEIWAKELRETSLISNDEFEAIAGKLSEER